MLDTYFAPAKINLGLEVLYKRPDGYHEINTLFCRVTEPHDVVTVTRGGFFQLTCSDKALPTDQRNLMIRAAEGFSQQIGEALPHFHIHLEKNIPIGAGLGGGSSDAATMLQIMQDWHSSQLENNRQDTVTSILDRGALLNLAASLGADIPFFLSGSNAAQASGIGEKLRPLAIKLEATVLIVFDSDIQISTRDAYASLSPSEEPSAIDYFKFFQSAPPLAKWKEQFGNDFEPEIFRRFPQLAGIKHSLYTHGASFALMSGSGSSVYGLFEKREAAQNAKLFFEGKGQLAFLSSPSL
jgi:4-diphosphocytidyl-2-C-methyl-D-erythritol kinase